MIVDYMIQCGQHECSVINFELKNRLTKRTRIRNEDKGRNKVMSTQTRKNGYVKAHKKETKKKK